MVRESLTETPAEVVEPAVPDADACNYEHDCDEHHEAMATRRIAVPPRHPNWTVTSSTWGIFLMAGSRRAISPTVSDDAR